MVSKGVELSFNIQDPVENKCYTYLSSLDIIRRTVFVTSLFKKFFRDEDISKLESRLLDIIDNLTKNGVSVNQIVDIPEVKKVEKIKEPEVKEFKKAYPKVSTSSEMISIGSLGDPLDKLADEGFN